MKPPFLERIALTAVFLTGLFSGVGQGAVPVQDEPGPTLVGLPRREFIHAEGAPGMFQAAQGWHWDWEAYVGTQSEAWADHGLGRGDFRVEIDLSLDEMKHTAASVRLGDSYFGFDGKDQRLYLNGPLFGGGVRLLDPASKYIEAGEVFRFAITRAGSRLRFAIDDVVVQRAQYEGPIARIGFVPLRGFMRVRRFAMQGAMELLPQPLSPRYTIPTIDLAFESDRQVLVDREPGQYLGHPTTILLENGRTMIVVYPKGHGRGPIVMKRSEDGGLTWSERLPVPESWASSKETPTIHRVVDRSGKKRLILFSGLYPIRMAVSEDDGQRWSELEAIGEFGGIVAMGCLDRLHNGDYMALFHDDGRFLRNEGRRGRFQVFKTVSKDGGLSWCEPIVIAEHPTAHLCEPGWVRSPDGKQIAVLLRENSRAHNSFVIFSDDEGETWSEPRELPAALTGDRHTARYAPDGRLFISFRDQTRVSPTKGDWVAWVGTYEDIRQGREGQYRVRLMDNTKSADCAYPGVEILPDGTLVTTTYGHWEVGEAPYIMSVRLRLEELDAKAIEMRTR